MTLKVTKYIDIENSIVITSSERIGKIMLTDVWCRTYSIRCFWNFYTEVDLFIITGKLTDTFTKGKLTINPT